MINWVLKLFKALNSDVGPWQIAFAGAFAMIIGLTPLWSLHNLVVLLLVFILRVHFGTFLTFWAIFSAFAYLLDPVFDQLGRTWLINPELANFWTGLYQSDWWQLARFNHTVTLASFVISAIAFFPVAFLFKMGVVRYRGSLMPWVNKLKIVQVLKGSKFYELYSKVEG